MNLEFIIIKAEKPCMEFIFQGGKCMKKLGYQLINKIM